MIPFISYSGLKTGEQRELSGLIHHTYEQFKLLIAARPMPLFSQTYLLPGASMTVTVMGGQTYIDVVGVPRSRQAGDSGFIAAAFYGQNWGDVADERYDGGIFSIWRGGAWKHTNVWPEIVDTADWEKGQKMAMSDNGVVIIGEAYWTAGDDLEVAVRLSDDWGATFSDPIVLQTGMGAGWALWIDVAVSGRIPIALHGVGGGDPGDGHTITMFSKDGTSWAKSTVASVTYQEDGSSVVNLSASTPNQDGSPHYAYLQDWGAATAIVDGSATTFSDAPPHAAWVDGVYAPNQTSVDIYSEWMIGAIGGSTHCIKAEHVQYQFHYVKPELDQDSGLYKMTCPFDGAIWRVETFGNYVKESGTCDHLVNYQYDSQPQDMKEFSDSTADVVILRNGSIAHTLSGMIDYYFELDNESFASNHHGIFAFVSSGFFPSAAHVSDYSGEMGIATSVDDGRTWQVSSITDCSVAATTGGWANGVALSRSTVLVVHAESSPWGQANPKWTAHIGAVGKAGVSGWKQIMLSQEEPHQPYFQHRSRKAPACALVRR